MNELKSRSGVLLAIQSGVTLIELLVTVVVLGILAAIAAPSFVDMINRNRLSGAAQTLYGELQRARAAAIKRDEEVYLYVDSGADWCVALSDKVGVPNCDCSTTDPCTLTENGEPVSYMTRASDFPNVVLNKSFSVSGDFIGFDPDLGMVVSGASGSFFLTSNGLEIDVTVSRLGRFNLCYPKGGTAVLGYEECP